MVDCDAVDCGVRFFCVQNPNMSPLERARPPNLPGSLKKMAGSLASEHGTLRIPPVSSSCHGVLLHIHQL